MSNIVKQEHSIGCDLVVLCCHLFGFVLQGYEIYLWQTFKNVECEQSLALFCAVAGIVGLCLNLLNCIFGNSRTGFDEKGNFTRCYKVTATCIIVSGIAIYVWLISLISNIDFNHHTCPAQMFNFVFSLFVLQSCILFCAGIGIVIWFSIVLN